MGAGAVLVEGLNWLVEAVWRCFRAVFVLVGDVE